MSGQVLHMTVDSSNTTQCT